MALSNCKGDPVSHFFYPKTIFEFKGPCGQTQREDGSKRVITFCTKRHIMGYKRILIHCWAIRTDMPTQIWLSANTKGALLHHHNSQIQAQNWIFGQKLIKNIFVCKYRRCPMYQQPFCHQLWQPLYTKMTVVTLVSIPVFFDTDKEP